MPKKSKNSLLKLKKISGKQLYFLRITSLLLFAWTVLILVLLIFQLSYVRGDIKKRAITEARTNFKKDQAFRFWGASHGGVYVPVDKNTPPNPYLSHISERDIQTPSGIKLTLMNPAYMVRQISEEFADLYGVVGHITSTKPLRPENAADDWEKKALLSFESGKEEVMEFTRIDNKSYLRLMRPLIAEKPCLKCHAHQGYKEGDIRGGIAVSIPMAAYLFEQRQEYLLNILSYSIVWILGIAGIMFGMKTFRRNMEAEEKKAELVAINQKLSDFAYVVSHDLKAPLHTISMLSSILFDDYSEKLDNGGREKLEMLVDRTHLMSDLIDGILEYSRVGSGEQKLIELDFDNFVKMIIYMINPPGNIDVRIEGKLPVVMCTDAMAEQIWQNLISNAVKYIDKPKGEIRIKCEPAGDFWKFSVSDNGPGIREEYFSSIFELFQAMPSNGRPKGTGVGLALVKRIIEVRGGRIWVESTPGQGSTFFFTYPTIEYDEQND